MIGVKKISHASYETPDLDKQVEYYTDILGLTLIAREKDAAYLANTVELFHILGTDQTYGTQNIALFNKWLVKHADLALDAANHLQPIWSQPRVKVASFSDALAHAKNRIKGIAAELGLKVPANLAP